MPPASMNASEPLSVRARRLGLFTQKSIVFAIFLVLFATLSLFLPGFLAVSNILTLFQSVAILGYWGWRWAWSSLRGASTFR